MKKIVEALAGLLFILIYAVAKGWRKGEIQAIRLALRDNTEAIKHLGRLIEDNQHKTGSKATLSTWDYALKAKNEIAIWGDTEWAYVGKDKVVYVFSEKDECFVATSLTI